MRPGDTVTGINQIAVALAQAEVAALDSHNALRRAERLTLCSLSHEAPSTRLSQASRSRSSASRHWSRPWRQPG